MALDMASDPVSRLITGFLGDMMIGVSGVGSILPNRLKKDVGKKKRKKSKKKGKK